MKRGWNSTQDKVPSEYITLHRNRCFRESPGGSPQQPRCVANIRSVLFPEDCFRPHPGWLLSLGISCWDMTFNSLWPRHSRRGHLPCFWVSHGLLGRTVPTSQMAGVPPPQHPPSSMLMPPPPAWSDSVGAVEACCSPWQQGWIIQSQKTAQMTKVVLSWPQCFWSKLATCHLGEPSTFCLGSGHTEV